MLLPVAKVTKLFGAERGGGVVVALYAEFPEDFAPESEPLFVRIDSLDVPLWCERFERRGAAGALAEFADWDTARRASELVGLELFVEADEERSDDEFYMEDLIGFAPKCIVRPRKMAGEAGKPSTGKGSNGKGFGQKTANDRSGQGKAKTGGRPKKTLRNVHKKK